MTDISEKLRSAPAPLREFFFGDAPRILCEEACLSYGLPESAVPATTKPLGAIFATPKGLREYPDILARLSGIDAPVAYGVASEVNRRIFMRFPEYFTDAEMLGKEWDSKKAAPTVSPEEVKRKLPEWEPWMLEEPEADEEEEVRRSRIMKMPLLQALGEHPKLGEQPITSARIAVPGKQDPVRPSLSNWIRAYRGELGVGYHEATQRARFLFDSPNGKGLSSEERERLNVIIRSIEENEPVDIDTKREAIVFPVPPEADRGGKPRGDAPLAPQGPASPRATPQAAVPTGPAPSAPARSESRKTPSPFTAAPVRAEVQSIRRPQPAPAPRHAAAPASLPVQPAPRRASGPVPDLNRSAGPRVASASDAPGTGNISFSSGHSLPGEGSSRGVISPHGFPERKPGPTAAVGSESAVRAGDPAAGEDSSGRVVDLRGDGE